MHTATRWNPYEEASPGDLPPPVFKASQQVVEDCSEKCLAFVRSLSAWSLVSSDELQVASSWRSMLLGPSDVRPARMGSGMQLRCSFVDSASGAARRSGSLSVAEDYPNVTAAECGEKELSLSKGQGQ